jgi:hypothetical protein
MIPRSRPTWPKSWRCMSGVPLDEPGNTKRVVRNQKKSRKSCKETDEYHLRRAPARLPSASSLARCLLLLPAMKFFGVLVLEKRSLDWQRLESRGLGGRLGGTRGSYLWDWQRNRGRRSWCISREIWEVERFP